MLSSGLGGAEVPNGSTSPTSGLAGLLAKLKGSFSGKNALMGAMMGSMLPGQGSSMSALLPFLMQGGAFGDDRTAIFKLPKSTGEDISSAY